MTSLHLVWMGFALALIYLPMTDEAPSWPRSGIKTLPLAAFALAAQMAGAPAVLVFGLALSAVGDLALSRPGQGAFLAGLVAFATAHLLYIFAFSGLSENNPWDAFRLAPLLAVFLLGVGLSMELWLVPYVGALRWPVRGYVVLIIGMGLAALAVPMPLLALGAGLFIASDILLALERFRMSETDPLHGPVGWLVWIFYVVGQALIVSAAVP